MIIDRINFEYNRWLENTETNTDMLKELTLMINDEKKIYESFYCDLSFGTGGVRGIMGAGTNRMNVFTLARITQAVSNYVKKNFAKDKWKIAISYDSRRNSDVFSEVAASVFAANGINVKLYHQIMPTPCLSYAVRELKCAAGVMITASHNSYEYNGYKVYDADGCQITNVIVDKISTELSDIDIFNDVKQKDFKICLKEKWISYIDKRVYSKYLDEVMKQSVLYGDDADKSIKIIYTPLNGTGLIPVTDILKKCGFHNIYFVKEQLHPNGDFPTCPYPNPEDREAMTLGIDYARKIDADVLLATDPDCDRVGVAIKDERGEYRLLTGNETGILLLDFICSQKVKHERMPLKPKFVKSIVTSNMAEKIAKKYNVETINVLTGFKYIGEYIGQLDKENQQASYIFGFEESCGYLSGTYVRDKDAVNGVLLICEMIAYHSAQGISLNDKLNNLYKEFGYYINTSYSYQFQGEVGSIKMNLIMNTLRRDTFMFGNKKTVKIIDYINGLNHLPKSNVIQYQLENDCYLIIRPSGTEPKLKVYIFVCSENSEEAEKTENLIINDLNNIFNLGDIN